VHILGEKYIQQCTKIMLHNSTALYAAKRNSVLRNNTTIDDRPLTSMHFANIYILLTVL